MNDVCADRCAFVGSGAAMTPIRAQKLEATTGFEPVNRGFAGNRHLSLGGPVSTSTVLDGAARRCAVPQTCVQRGGR